MTSKAFPPAGQSVLALLLFLSVAISLVYFPITQYNLYDPGTGGKEGDVALYTRMSQGAPLDSIPKPYRYRVLTPFLARLVPFLPRGMSQFYDVDREKILKFKFGVVNMIGLTLSAYTLFLLLRTLAFSPLEALTGGFLFLTSFHVVTYGGVPLVDPWGYFFLFLGLLCVLRRWYVPLAIVVLLGMLAKETTALLVVYILFLPRSWKERGLALLACLPGLVEYAIFRFVLAPTNIGFQYGVGSALRGILQALVPNRMWAYIAFDGGMAFGAVWLLGLVGWWQSRRADDRTFWRLGFVVPLIMLIPFAIGSNIGRIWFLGFPVMIPLALIGVRSVLGGAGAGRSERFV